MNFFGNLLSEDDRSVCVIAACGILSMLSLIAFAGYALVMHPETFSPIAYAGGATSVLGGIGGARRLRDGLPTSSSLTQSSPGATIVATKTEGAV